MPQSKYFFKLFRVYNKKQILININFVNELLFIISKFIEKSIDSSFEQIKEKINDDVIGACLKNKQERIKEIEMNFEYLTPICFLNDIEIQKEDLLKKKTGHYLKLKANPKWINYALDILR